MANRLMKETSPYLKQHANNPVDWYPWDDEALQKAQKENKPIFLSIGYSACHWCHVMAHESFEDLATATFLNNNFINIKVDREEHPELDNLYMAAVVAMTGQGGWPMSIFLTPRLDPFYGGTYFPPSPRAQLPGFMQILKTIQNAWEQHHTEIQRAALDITSAIKDSMAGETLNTQDSSQTIIDTAVIFFEKYYDWKNGGWGSAPKFPQPMIIDFLISQACRANKSALAMVDHNLQSMQMGGLHDLVGGGFHRYSTDVHWLIPHFEKMLYDNAQLANAYLHGYLLTRNPDFKTTCTRTLDFILSDLRGPDGEFYCSLDADSEGEEGKYYLWSQSEIEGLFHSSELLGFFKSHFGTFPENHSSEPMILRIETHQAGEQPSAIYYSETMESLLEVLRQGRQKRIRPHRDEKVLTSWNALTIRALAEAGRYLENQTYLRAAQVNAAYILANHRDGTTLYHTRRDNQAHIHGFLEDYASMIIALVFLYQADFNEIWLESAVELCERMIAEFRDPQGGFFDTSPTRKDLAVIPKFLEDNATPSGNSLAVYALLLLSELVEIGNFRPLAEHTLQQIQGQLVRYPPGYAFWLQGLDLSQGPVQQVFLSWPLDKAINIRDWLHILNKDYHPRRMIGGSADRPKRFQPYRFPQNLSINNQITAFVCNNFVCNQPVHTIQALLTQLTNF